MRNVFFLKCATQLGLVTIWNLLIRVPGELPEDYAQMESWIPHLSHLRPPTGGAPRIECHRYSPYFAETGRWVADVRPARWYSGVFPSDELDLSKVAYYFEGQWKDTLGDPAYDGILSAAHEWMRRWRSATVPRLTLEETSDKTVLIHDTRGPEPRVWRLGDIETSIYRAMDDMVTPRNVKAQLGEVASFTVDDVREVMMQFVRDGLALHEGDCFLGLAIPPATVPSAEVRSVEMRRVTNQYSTTSEPVAEYDSSGA